MQKKSDFLSVFTVNDQQQIRWQQQKVDMLYAKILQTKLFTDSFQKFFIQQIKVLFLAQIVKF